MQPGDRVRIEIRATFGDAPTLSLPGHVVGVSEDRTRARVRVERGGRALKGFGGIEAWVKIPLAIQRGGEGDVP